MRPYTFLFLFLSVWATRPLSAQDGSPNGLLWDDEQYQQSAMMKYYPLSERGGDIPSKRDLRPYCPTPQDQGDIASCVGYALAHALTIAKAIRKEWKDQPATIDRHAHSASFIYNQVKLDGRCKSGAYLSAGLRLLKQQGDCLLQDFGNTPHSCQPAPQPGHKQKASAYRIYGYKRMFDPNDSNKKKLDQIRVALANWQPAVIGMHVPYNLKTAPLGQLDWKPSASDAGHALVVVGYDEEKREFELLNSYGPGWGDGGFFKLPYDVVASRVRYGYCMDLGADFGCE